MAVWIVQYRDRETFIKTEEMEKLRPYVLRLAKMLEEAWHEDPAALDPGSATFSRCSAVLLKSGDFPGITYGKKKLVHIYRSLVRNGELEYVAEVEGCFTKKLRKSTFGGVNVSVFIPRAIQRLFGMFK